MTQNSDLNNFKRIRKFCGEFFNKSRLNVTIDSLDSSSSCELKAAMRMRKK